MGEESYGNDRNRPTIYGKLIDAINALSKPTYFDWIVLATSLLAISLTYIIYKRQTAISLRLAEIASEQNKIALFKTRLESYVTLNNYTILIKRLMHLDKIYYADIFYDFTSLICKNKSFHEKIKTNTQLTQSIFLFNNIHQTNLDNLSEVEFNLKFNHYIQLLSLYQRIAIQSEHLMKPTDDKEE